MRLRKSPSITPAGGFRVVENPPDPLSGFTLMEQIALLGMLYLPVAKTVVALLCRDESVQVKPYFRDYQKLAQAGLCIRPVGQEFHRLTNEGQSIARFILAKQCQRLNVHDMLEERGSESTYFKCSCGAWSRVVRNSGSHQWLRMHQSFSAHVPKNAREIA